MSKTFKGEDLTEKKFGRWRVLNFYPNDKPGSHWLCECNCNDKTQRVVKGQSLLNGKSQSCNCLNYETLHKQESLIGKKFNKLTVISMNKEQSRTRWNCECECGKTSIVRTDALKSGHTVSCGCIKIKDISNMRFGRLLALESTDIRYHNSVVWKCKCDCEAICFASSHVLYNGLKKSCGCLAIETHTSNLLDMTFGRLTVIEKTSKRNFSNVIWKCQCSCASKTIIQVPSSRLLNGHTQSCGCIKSIGEENIGKVFIDNNINFTKNYSFSDLKSNKNWFLWFDFGVLDYDDILLYLIEFDGIQHSKNTFNLTEEEFQFSLQRDQLKNEYCIKNNITLIRIPYKERDRINIEMLKLNTSPYIFIQNGKYI